MIGFPESPRFLWIGPLCAVVGVLASQADSALLTTGAALVLMATAFVVIRARCGDTVSDIWSVIRR